MTITVLVAFVVLIGWRTVDLLALFGGRLNLS
ncbi:integral membrane protein [Mycobacterium tuberculosis]|nr:integral membrane protein [Mycobacterium tuberculosis]CPA31691.1 integral membrane protein [Mycobacterium tuberculosis]